MPAPIDKGRAKDRQNDQTVCTFVEPPMRIMMESFEDLTYTPRHECNLRHVYLLM